MNLLLLLTSQVNLLLYFFLLTSQVNLFKLSPARPNALALGRGTHRLFGSHGALRLGTYK